MSQNGPYPGPPWSSGGGSEEPYAEPADPWGNQGSSAPNPDPHWGGHSPSIPMQPVSYHSAPISGSGSMWGRPTPTPPPPGPKRNTPMVALVVTLGVLIVVGLGATLWLLRERNKTAPTAAGETSAAAQPGPAPAGSEDARFVKKGDCVVNEGSDVKPEMRATPCTSGTYVVLARLDGPTTGEKDAEKKCGKVQGYTKWYFFDSSLDDLDFVLCLKEHKSF